MWVENRFGALATPWVISAAVPGVHPLVCSLVIWNLFMQNPQPTEVSVELWNTWGIFLYHTNILPDSQSCFREGLVIVFLICLLCLLGHWDSRVNASGTILPEKVRQFFKYQMCTLVTLHTVPLTSYSLPAWFISQRIHTGGIRDCREWDIILETAEDEIFLWLKLLYIQKPHSILLQRHSVQPL